MGFICTPPSASQRQVNVLISMTQDRLAAEFTVGAFGMSPAYIASPVVRDHSPHAIRHSCTYTVRSLRAQENSGMAPNCFLSLVNQMHTRARLSSS